MQVPRVFVAAATGLSAVTCFVGSVACTGYATIGANASNVPDALVCMFLIGLPITLFLVLVMLQDRWTTNAKFSYAEQYAIWAAAIATATCITSLFGPGMLKLMGL